MTPVEKIPGASQARGRFTALLEYGAERFPVSAEAVRHLTNEPVPHHLKRWWWCLGGTPLYLLVIQIVTGILLTLYYVPTPEGAYNSVRAITEEVQFGWYIRGVHKWAASMILVALLLHMLRVLVTGSYRRPREFTWLTGFALLGLMMTWAFTGYSLVYEQLSYWGAVVGTNIAEATPLVGGLIADFMRGGPEVGANTLSRFYVFHIGAIPTLSFGLLALHLALVRLHGVSEFHFADETSAERETPTYPFFPHHAMTELMIGTFLLFLLTILAIVFPAELGPVADPTTTPEHIKPEWYFYAQFRWLKLVSFQVGVVGTMVGMTMLAIWPWLEPLIPERIRARDPQVALAALLFTTFILFTAWEAVV